MAGEQPEAGTVTAEQAMMLLMLDKPAQLKASGARRVQSARWHRVATGSRTSCRATSSTFDKPDTPVPVSSAAMAEHLDCAPSYVRKLVDAGVIERRSDGKFDLDQCRTKYLAHLREARKVSPRSLRPIPRSRRPRLRWSSFALTRSGQHRSRMRKRWTARKSVGMFLAALSSYASGGRGW